MRRSSVVFVNSGMPRATFMPNASLVNQTLVRRAPAEEEHMRRLAAVLVGLTLIGPGAAWAQTDRSESTPQQVLFGAGSVLGTIVYAPFKATFCILGSLTAAATSVVSMPTATKVVGASCRGTWAITPDVVRGKETVHFVGDVSRSEALAKQ